MGLQGRSMKSATRHQNITAILLAGGKSRRMGQDKRFVPLEGGSLFDRSLSTLERLFPEILVVVAEQTPELSGLRHRIVTDAIPNCATLGGLYTGLLHAQHARVFAAACDMPFLNAAVIDLMVTIDQQADVVIAKLAHGLQPMHALYSKACLPYLESMAKRGSLKVQGITEVHDLAVRIITEDELRRAEAHLLSFMNINTPADLEFARKLLSSRQRTGGQNG